MSIIQVDDLSFAYPPPEAGLPPIWVLRGISFEVEKGELVAIMGPMGAGKTTLATALNGIVPRSTGGIIRGEVRVAGFNTKRHEVHELARHVGVVFQEPENQLFNRDVESEIAFGLENLGLPRDEIKSRIDWALAAVGLNSTLRRSPFELSGGQKQRLAIGAVLAMKPDVLVLDEPTASLDSQGQSQLIQVIAELRQEVDLTAILISNDPELVLQLAERVMVMKAGQVLLEGDPLSVLGDVGRLREIGLASTQMAELSHRLREGGFESIQFSDVESAYAALSQPLSQARGRGT